MRCKFKKFGRNSYIMKPYMLTNARYIEIDDQVIIRGYSRIEAIKSDNFEEQAHLIRIGKGTKIEQFFHVGACDLVDIGDNVLIASRVFITDHNHCFYDINVPIKHQGFQSGGKVVIEKNAWIGEGCVILPGVTIGRNSVIGANAVVTKDIPPYSVAVGAPAKVIKKFDFSHNRWISLK